MAQDVTKFLLGTTQSSAKEISSYPMDPAAFPAGLAVSLSSNGDLSLLKSGGQRVGVSLGKSLSDHKRTAIARSGEGVPALLNLKKASGVATVSSYANLVSGTADTLTVGATVFTAQAGAVTPGSALFQAATSNDATAISLAAQINAHATAGALVKAVAASGVVTISAKAGGTAGNNIALVYVDNTTAGITLSGLSGGKLSGGSDVFSDISYVTKGAKVYFSDTTGQADAAASNATISDAIYVSGVLTGIDESGASVPCALIDMPGGL